MVASGCRCAGRRGGAGMRWRVTNGIDSAVVTAADEASAMRVFWRGLVARRLPTYNGQTTATAIGIHGGPGMAKMTAAQKKAFLARMAAGRVKAGKAAAGRVTGRKVVRKSTRKGAKRSAAMVHAGAAMTASKGRQSGAMGTGTPVARLKRVEGAIMDLARANHAVVSKVVEHERRLNTVESTLSNWAAGRR